jgi:hypothetical protein
MILLKLQYPTNMLLSGRMLITGTPFLFPETEFTLCTIRGKFQLVTQHRQLYHRQFIHDAVELCQAKDTLLVQKTGCCSKPATHSHPRKNTPPVKISQKSQINYNRKRGRDQALLSCSLAVTAHALPLSLLYMLQEAGSRASPALGQASQ